MMDELRRATTNRGGGGVESLCPPPPPPPSLVTIFRTFVGGLGNSGAASDDGGCGGESGAVDPVIRICLRRSGVGRGAGG